LESRPSITVLRKPLTIVPSQPAAGASGGGIIARIAGFDNPRRRKRAKSVLRR
jgi:hypothetical protein